MKYLFTFLIIAATPAGAEDLDKNSQKALENTVKLLNTQHQRDRYIKGHDGAKASDNYIDQITGSNQAQKQKIYELSAKIFQRLVKQNNGDLNKVSNSIFQGQQNPESLANGFSDEERKLLRDIASEISKQPSPAPK